MPLLTAAHGTLDYLVTGHGAPVTVFAHGLAGSIAETRPLAGGVSGRRVFLHFRGHGGSSAGDDDWSYAALAADLRAVADATAATRALGVSMGAGALTALVAETPDRFERLVFFLPAAFDRPRDAVAERRLERMAACVDARDLLGLADLLLLEHPAEVRERRDVRAWVRAQADTLAAMPIATALRSMASMHPVADASHLGAVTAPALVLAQLGDQAHPAAVAEHLARALPNARLEMLPEGGALWTHRRRVRELVSGFLDAEQG